MSKNTSVRNSWTGEQRFDEALVFSEAGLSLGGRLILAQPYGGFDFRDGKLKEDDRLNALLSIAFRKRLSPYQMHHVAEAAGDSNRGDQALANIRLALAGLASIPEPVELPLRVSLAEQLLAGGMSGDALVKALGLQRSDLARRYNPNQPRVPAGNGVTSGRFSDGSGSAQASAPSASISSDVVLPLAGELGLLAPELGLAVSAALSTLAATVGASAVLGMIFVPIPRSVSSTGPLPGETGAHYDYNHDEGVLRLIDTTGVRPVALVTGQKDRKGIFRDVDTGLAFAREIDGVLVFDVAAMADAAEKDDGDARAQQDAETQSDGTKSSAKLCPDPGIDAPHGASIRSKAYQALVSAINNPQRPLPEGLAVNLRNPMTGRLVYFDDCRESDGTMIEAKGPGFGRMLGSQYLQKVIRERWLDQGRRQSSAAVGRKIDWFIADGEAATVARELFGQESLLNITVRHLPAGHP